jgi:lipopolysaccharide assembly protein A
MQFLRTAFWVVIAVAAALFFKANNKPLDIKIWGDIVWETRVWFPIFLAFLLGALPFWIMARVTRWRLRRQVQGSERALAAAAAAAPMTPTMPVSPVAETPIAAHDAADASTMPSPLPGPTGSL